VSYPPLTVFAARAMRSVQSPWDSIVGADRAAGEPDPFRLIPVIPVAAGLRRRLAADRSVVPIDRNPQIRLGSLAFR
jgi:hypothetical protein